MQAFPFIEPADDPAIKAYHPGISLRDYFAAEAMRVVFTKLIDALQGDDIVPDEKIIQAKTLAAGSCYAIADAMLKARKA